MKTLIRFIMAKISNRIRICLKLDTCFQMEFAQNLEFDRNMHGPRNALPRHIIATQLTTHTSFIPINGKRACKV